MKMLGPYSRQQVQSLKTSIVFIVVVAQSFPTLSNPIHGLSPSRLLSPRDSPSNTGVGCHALRQGLFPTQGLNLGRSHCRRFFTIWVTSWVLCSCTVVLPYLEGKYSQSKRGKLMQSAGKSRAPIHCTPKAFQHGTSSTVVLGPRWWRGCCLGFPRRVHPEQLASWLHRQRGRAAWGALLTLRQGAEAAPRLRSPRPRPPASRPQSCIPRPAPPLHWSGGCASGGPGGDPDPRQKTVRTAGCPSRPPFPLAFFSVPSTLSPSLLSAPRPAVAAPGWQRTSLNPKAERTARGGAGWSRRLPASFALSAPMGLAGLASSPRRPPATARGPTVWKEDETVGGGEALFCPGSELERRARWELPPWRCPRDRETV